MNSTHPEPEWRRLFEGIAPLLQEGRTDFSYEELQVLAGIDIRTPRGRQQFFRFRKEALVTWNIWFDNLRELGYRAIAPKEHVSAAGNRVSRARRMSKQALSIITNVRWQELKEEELSKALQAQAVIASLVAFSKDAAVKTRRLAGAIEHPRLAAPAEGVGGQF